ncbi:MAG: hypothetical protein CL902_13335 [Dehalococcoidia bacterium]|nr:hypothetical protein [Dehalococcoidia bacterium]
MASGTPTEFLTLLNVGGDYNFGQYTAGAAAPGTDVRTNYSKIRFDVASSLVDIGDQTFATSTGSLLHDGNPVTSMSYATAMGCAGVDNGLANIDLTGLPFTVIDPFEAYGGSPGSVSISSGNQIADITGGGWCGWFSPAPSWFAPNYSGGGFILDLGFTGVVEPSVYEIVNEINEKVDVIDVQVDGLDTSNLDAAVSSRASQTSITDLSTEVGTRASQSSITALGPILTSLASQASVDSVNAKLDADLDTSVSSRASRSSITALGAILITIASQASVDALDTKVDASLDTTVSSRASQTSAESIEGKLDSSLDTTVSSRATQTSIAALEVKIDNLEAQLDTVLLALQALEAQIAALPIGGQGSGGTGGGRP